MEADDRTPAVGAPLGAAAASGSTPLSKRGLSGPADEAAAAAYGGAEAAMMLWTLQHHPSSNANVKLGGAGGGNIPNSPLALKSLPSPLRRSLRSYPSAAAILEGPGGPPGAAGADIFSRGRDALLLQQQQRQQRQQQEEGQRPGLPASPSRPGGNGTGTSSPPMVLGMHGHSARPSASPLPVLGPRLSRHAPLPSFSPRKPKSTSSASKPAAADASGLPLPLPPSPLPALAPVSAASNRPATPPTKLPAARQAPSDSGSSPRSGSGMPSNGRPPSPLQRSKTLPSTRSSSSSSVPSSPIRAMVRTNSTGGRRRSDSLPSSPTTPATPIAGSGPAVGGGPPEPVPVSRAAGARTSTSTSSSGSGSGSSKKKVKKKVAFEQQPAQSPPTPPPQQPRSRSGSVSSVASLDGDEAVAGTQRFARQAPASQAAAKTAACDLSQLPEQRRRRLLGLLSRLTSDMDDEEEEVAAAGDDAAAAAATLVPAEVVALQRRIREAAVAVAGAGSAGGAIGGDHEEGAPTSPLLLGPAALRTQVQRDFGVKPTRAEASALARYLTASQGWGLKQKAGSEEPVLDYACAQRFLRQSQQQHQQQQQQPPLSPCRTEGGDAQPPPPQLKRRSILQEEAAKSELAFVPRDAPSRALLEKMGEAASSLDRHRCDARFRPRADWAAGGAMTVPTKVSVEELAALAERGLGLPLEPSELSLVARWFGDHHHDGSGLSLEDEKEGAQQGQGGGQHTPGLVDYDIFLQHFWALGAAAKRMRRKEEAQQRFLHVLASVGTGDHEAASG